MDTSGIRIDCYVRAASLNAPDDETIETLQDYDRRGVIDDLTVEGWPDEVVLKPNQEESKSENDSGVAGQRPSESHVGPTPSGSPRRSKRHI